MQCSHAWRLMYRLTPGGGNTTHSINHSVFAVNQFWMERNIFQIEETLARFNMFVSWTLRFMHGTRHDQTFLLYTTCMSCHLGSDSYKTLNQQDSYLKILEPSFICINTKLLGSGITRNNSHFQWQSGTYKLVNVPIITGLQLHLYIRVKRNSSAK